MHNQQLSSHQLGLFNCTGAATLNCFVIGTSPPPRARTHLAAACGRMRRSVARSHCTVSGWHSVHWRFSSPTREFQVMRMHRL